LLRVWEQGVGEKNQKNFGGGGKKEKTSPHPRRGKSQAKTEPPPRNIGVGPEEWGKKNGTDPKKPQGGDSVTTVGEKKKKNQQSPTGTQICRERGEVANLMSPVRKIEQRYPEKGGG